MIEIYCDGACKGNPGPGGWGFLVVTDPTEEPLEAYGGSPDTTNNQMELTAAIKALKVCPAGSVVDIHTDSQYVIKGIHEWLPGWKKRGWKTAAGKPVKNQELWVELDAAVQHHTKVKFHWVKGHAGHPLNERADQLANSGVPK